MSYRYTYYILLSLLLCGLSAYKVQAQVATSMWLRVSPADSTRAGYRVIEAEGQTRHIIPILEWTASPETDTYHQLHHHGVAIESDLMAYRIYFDRKQTVDVYAKKTPRLELATSYWYPSDKQLAEHYGDDILRVSGTIGVGSVKPWNGTKMIHIEPVESRSQRIVEQTADKAVMEVSVHGWHTEGKVVDMTVRYTILAGHRDMTGEVFLSEPLDSLCTGVQLLPQGGRIEEVPFLGELTETDNGILLGSWGTDWPVNDSIKYAKETVGLGVYIPAEYAYRPVHDKRNHLALFRPKTYLRFYLTTVSLKEDNPPAQNEQDFYAYLRQWKQRFE